jgi:NAD(P)H-hydrate epimerase
MGHIPEATWLPLAQEDGWISPEAAALVIEGVHHADALLIGPGLGQADCTREFIRRLVSNSLPRMVVDADGLKHLAKIENWQTLLPRESILTPHPGEMAVLTGWDKEAIQSERLACAENFARAWGHVVVLKGAFTVVAAPDGRSGVVPVATSALAHAGTGDVLAGMIVGMLAQGIPAYETAATCAWVHAQAGLNAAERLGYQAGVTAWEVVMALDEIFSWVTSAD